jgi:plasmid stability protein
MPTITLKNIPEPLYKRLKHAAETHRRSLNSEILVCLETVLAPSRHDVSKLLEAARAVRERTAHYRLTDQELDATKRSGRP